MINKFLIKKISNSLRMLSIDSIKKANSGHIGMPLGMIEISIILWIKYYFHNPCNPKWFNRDFFILSNGHGSILHYILLHLTGYNLTINDIKNFRQIYSKTAGHPEYKLTPGVETTTGPLGQGLANAVGIALSEKLLSYEFNKPNFKIINHYTYVFVGDGCLMEGISHEVCSFAGTLCLSKLIIFYDNNKISIDGKVKKWCNDNIKKRFISYGWNVINNVDGYNFKNINKSIIDAKKSKKPSIICFSTIIGKGSKNLSGTSEVHSKIFNTNEILDIKKNLNCKNWKNFKISKEIYLIFNFKNNGYLYESKWNKKFNLYKKIYPIEAGEFIRRKKNKLSLNFKKKTKNFIYSLIKKKNSFSTRLSSYIIINKYSKILPEFLGGSADLTNSNLTKCNKAISIRYNKNGNYINYGIREFGMSAIINGIALYKSYIPFGGTFLTFSDYSRNALRMAALMKIKSIFIFTHDSIGLGEDGPTHQPIEHLLSLRSIPNINLWRTCDIIETAIAWQQSILKKGPNILIFSKQNILSLKHNYFQINNIKKGGYIIYNIFKSNITLISTGSEINLIYKIMLILKKINIKSVLVSIPNINLFLNQNSKYKNKILKKNILNFFIEASNFNLKKNIINITNININIFGKSAKSNDLFQYFGFNKYFIINKIQKKINKLYFKIF